MPGRVRAGDAERAAWLDALARAAAYQVGGAIGWISRQVEAIWLEARRAGLVAGEPARFVDSVVRRITGAFAAGGEVLGGRFGLLTDRNLAEVERYMATTAAPPLNDAQLLCFDAPLLGALAGVSLAAAESGWTTARHDEAASNVARMYGLDGLNDNATMAAKYLEREILNGASNGALVASRQVDEHRALYPYIRYAALPGARPNHQALDGFVLRVGSPIEPLVSPPNGWACQCRWLPVSWQEAAALGWRGDAPLGFDRYRDFLALGGPDDGFPKGVFIDGLPNSLAGC